MKQIVRFNTFETNSSSMHSLVIVKEPKPYTARGYNRLIDNYFENSGFELFGCCSTGYYGRYPFQVLKSQIDKLRYYVAYYIGNLGKKELIPQVINFIHKQTKCPLEKININSYDEYESCYEKGKYGYATSNASGTGEDVFYYIEKNNISMEDFVLNPKYVVIVDGDEYKEFKKLFESHILDADDFEYISNGAPFWNEDDWGLSLYWLENKSSNVHINKKSCVDKYIDKFVKSITVSIYNTTETKLYKKYFKTLKKFFEWVREKYPSIKLQVETTEDFEDALKKEDLSIFEYMNILKHEYSDKVDRVIDLRSDK